MRSKRSTGTAETKTLKRVRDLPAKKLGDNKTRKIKGGMPQGPPNRSLIPPGPPI
jgi:hypothetical protein